MDTTSLDTQWHQIAICAALTERSFPNFALFCELESKGDDLTSARKMLNKVWEFLRGQLKSQKNIEKQLETIQAIIPNPEDYEHYGAYPAMDTMLGLQSCLQGIVDSSIRDADTILVMMRERLQEVIALQTDEDTLSETVIEQNPLWVRHQEFEGEVFALLTRTIAHAEHVEARGPLSSDNGVSHIGICVND